MGRMVDGKWSDEEWKPADENEEGSFEREESVFRDSIADEDWEPGRYHLYVAWTCPWAHRTLLTRSLKGLENDIPVHFCNEMTDKSWRFSDDNDGLYDSDFLYELYLKADPEYTGRVTVPTLWDSVEETIVNNESSEIIRIFDGLPSDRPRLAPPELVDEIDEINERFYETLNNGVYRAGFASSQKAYEEAVYDVFSTLEWLDRYLEDRTWLVGDRLTESDVRLFVTLARFDLAYYTLFRCNWKRIAEYANLQRHLEQMFDVDGVVETCNLTAAKAGYASLKAVNPEGIVPVGPPVDLPTAPTGFELQTRDGVQLAS